MTNFILFLPILESCKTADENLTPRQAAGNEKNYFIIISKQTWEEQAIIYPVLEPEPRV